MDENAEKMDVSSLNAITQFSSQLDDCTVKIQMKSFDIGNEN